MFQGSMVAMVTPMRSDGALDADIISELERHGVRTRHLNRSYLSHILAEDRAGEVRRALSRIYVMNKGRIVTEIAPAEIHDESIVRAYLAI